MTVSVTRDIAIATVANIPSKSQNLSEILSRIADIGVNIDMISQSVPQGDKINLSFSLPQRELGKILEISKVFKKISPSISTEINGYNAKITFKSEKMKYEIGSAAGIFREFNRLGIFVKMISTAESEISCIIDEKDAENFKF